MLGANFEALPDDHHAEPKYLVELSRLFQRTGNHAERKRLLTRTLELERQRGGDDLEVARILRHLSSVNRSFNVYGEGIRQAEEASKVLERLGGTKKQMKCLCSLARPYMGDKQLDAAEKTATRALSFSKGKGQEYIVCDLHWVLGDIYRSKGDKKKSIQHYEMALEIASSHNWLDILFCANYALVNLFKNEHEFGDANVHIERAKSCVPNDTHKLGRAMRMRADIWRRKLRLEYARLEALRALEIFEELGAAKDAEDCQRLLQKVKRAIEVKNRSTGLRGELLETIPRHFR